MYPVKVNHILQDYSRQRVERVLNLLALEKERYKMKF